MKKTSLTHLPFTGKKMNRQQMKQILGGGDPVEKWCATKLDCIPHCELGGICVRNRCICNAIE